MWKTPAASALVLSLGTLVLTPAPAAAADDAKAVVENASLAMGAAGLNAITLLGLGRQRQLRPEPDDLVRPGVDDHPQLHAHDRLHAARVSRIRRPDSARRARRSAAAARRAGQLRSADHAGERRRGRSSCRSGSRRGDFCAARRPARTRRCARRRSMTVPYRIVTWSPAQKAPSGQPYKVVGLHQPREPGRSRRNLGRAPGARRPARRGVLQELPGHRRAESPGADLA